MPIKFSCPHCKKTLQVKDELAGQKRGCPACKKPLVIPTQSAATPPVAKKPRSSSAGGTGSGFDLEALAAATLSEKQAEAPATAATVAFSCPWCDAELHLPADLAGKQAPCPECKRIVRVPQLARTGPRDWRQPQTQTGPTGAKRADETPEGTWGTESTSGVSRQALVEAKVIKEAKEPWTVTQWIVRGGSLVVLLALLVGGTVWFLNYRKGRMEQDALARANQFLAESKPGAVSPELRAELLRYLGEYYHRAGLVDAQGLGGVPRVQQARQTAEQIGDPVEQMCVLRDILRAQAELGLEAEEIGQTLALAPPGLFRREAAREVTRIILAAGPQDEAAVSQRAEKVRQIIMRGVPSQPVARAAEAGKPADGEMDHSEKLACLSVLGQELLRLGHKNLTTQLVSSCQTYYQPERTRAREWAALRTQLNFDNPGLDAMKDTASVTAGKAEAQAREPRFGFDAAKRTMDEQLGADFAAKLDLSLALAQLAVDGGQKDRALAFLKEAEGILAGSESGEAPWRRLRVAELAAAAGEPAEAERLAAALASPAAQDRARLAALLLKWSAQTDAACDPDDLKALRPGAAAYAVAVVELARHNARLDPSGTASWSESVEPAQARPYAAIGVALGLLDRR
jgi:hypothetical protein